MKRSLAAVLIVALALVAQRASAEPVTFDFANEIGAAVTFIGTGDKIEFARTSYNFVITGSSPGGLVGLSGDIIGTFLVGTITSPIPGVEQAAITSTDGKFVVYGGGDALTADLDLKNIIFLNDLSGVMNASGLANLSNIVYSGSNSALLAIRDGQQQAMLLTFQFPPLGKKSLAELMADGEVNGTSFSGSLSSVPEPSTFVLLAGAVIGLAAFVWRRRA